MIQVNNVAIYERFWVNPPLNLKVFYGWLLIVLKFEPHFRVPVI